MCVGKGQLTKNIKKLTGIKVNVHKSHSKFFFSSADKEAASVISTMPNCVVLTSLEARGWELEFKVKYKELKLKPKPLHYVMRRPVDTTRQHLWRVLTLPTTNLLVAEMVRSSFERKHKDTKQEFFIATVNDNTQ